MMRSGKCERPKWVWVLPTTIWLLVAANLLADELAAPKLVDTFRLPDVEYGGESAHIHTQGLFVTDQFFYVTGRLERAPKRPLLLRFPRRSGPNLDYELLDISPPDGPHSLDHPGGFDFDGTYFWVPIGQSRPGGETAIVRIQVSDVQPLKAAVQETVFRVQDHIGAVACRKSRPLHLYGANWDTKDVYVWDQRGKLIRKQARQTFSPQLHIAVQDWKFHDGVLIAGGIDKRSPAQPRARVFWQNADSTVAHIDFPTHPDSARPLTNEGLDMFEEDLFLLPEDIGQGAKVMRFKLPVQVPHR